jgi:hypothetical protein
LILKDNSSEQLHLKGFSLHFKILERSGVIQKVKELELGVGIFNGYKKAPLARGSSVKYGGGIGI